MRASFLLVALFPLLAMGCSSLDFAGHNRELVGDVGTIPPQTDKEPHTILLSEMTKRLGWHSVETPGVRDHAIGNVTGDRITFTEGEDVLSVNNMLWRFERDAVAKPGNDLLLPESVFDWVAKRYGRSDLVRKKARGSYDMDPLTPPAQTHAPEKAIGTELKGMTICIDAGHGGKDPGGMANGFSEKNVTLAVALRLQKLCEAAGAKVLMTRNSDTYPELDERCALANDKHADLFISIHANIMPTNDDITGCEGYYNENSDSSRRLTQDLVAAIVKHTGVVDRGARKDIRGLRVLTKTKMAATLIELGYLTNKGEALKLNTKEMQDKMAQALFNGLTQYAAGERKPVVSR